MAGSMDDGHRAVIAAEREKADGLVRMGRADGLEGAASTFANLFSEQGEVDSSGIVHALAHPLVALRLDLVAALREGILCGLGTCELGDHGVPHGVHLAVRAPQRIAELAQFVKVRGHLVVEAVEQ
ncbi:hypothetical protein [Variovorax paradoxus]|nr:hypothetical protein [Variovorax paradoxus]